MNILAFSGGKDSTALALRLAEQGEDFVLFFTPTFRELPECIDHIVSVKEMTGKELVVRTAGKTLDQLIQDKKTLPNQNMRWCTRTMKIEPCKAYLLENPGSVLLVGLRADEEHREGMWGEFATYRYPLREWGWGIKEVYAYLNARGVNVPDRTDCDYCYDQRLSEWWLLWKNRPERYAHAAALEKLTGHTFRSPSRDTWPAGLIELAGQFANGRTPKGIIPLPLFGTYDEPAKDRCRVCSM